MTIIETIKSQQVQSRKDRDSLKSMLLTTLLGEATMIGKNDGNRESTDSEVVAVIKKFVKNIDETVKFLEKEAKTNEEKMTVLSKEKEILETFLPKQLSEVEIREVVNSIVLTFEEKNPKLMGKVISVLKERHNGQYDGALASKIVKEALS
jgi:uncharacterized protein YqeY